MVFLIPDKLLTVRQRGEGRDERILVKAAYKRKSDHSEPECEIYQQVHRIGRTKHLSRDGTDEGVKAEILEPNFCNFSIQV